MHCARAIAAYKQPFRRRCNARLARRAAQCVLFDVGFVDGLRFGATEGWTPHEGYIIPPYSMGSFGEIGPSVSPVCTSG